MLNPVERLIACTILLVAVVDIAFVVIKDVAVDIEGYAAATLIGLFLLLSGQLYRRFRPALHVSTALCGSGLFILFSLVGSTLNYTFLPTVNQSVDPFLMRFDAMLGYDWPSVVTFAAQHSWIGYTLFLVYATSLPQLLLLVCWYGFSGDDRRLHHFLLTGMVGALASVIFWFFFPTFGAKSYNTLPQWVMETIPLAVDPAYGRELLRLAAEGVSYLSPKNVLGLIAFPSFHIVMACMSLAFAPRLMPVRILFYVVNVLMFPAVLVQGGHFLVDIAGGVIMFLLAWLVARALLSRLSPERAPSTTLQVA